MSSVGMAVEAGDIVRRMVSRESRGWGDQVEVQRRLEQRYGIPFWSLDHLRTNRAKTCETSLFLRIQAAFADQCGKHAARLLREADEARKAYPHVHLDDIEDQIRALQARLADAKAHQAGKARR